MLPKLYLENLSQFMQDSMGWIIDPSSVCYENCSLCNSGIKMLIVE